MWLDIGIVALLLFGIYCFTVLTGFEKRYITRRTDRRAQDMYDQFANSPRKQRRHADEHGGPSREEHPGSRPGSPR